MGRRPMRGETPLQFTRIYTSPGVPLMQIQGESGPLGAPPHESATHGYNADAMGESLIYGDFFTAGPIFRVRSSIFPSSVFLNAPWT